MTYVRRARKNRRTMMSQKRLKKRNPKWSTSTISLVRLLTLSKQNKCKLLQKRLFKMKLKVKKKRLRDPLR